ncbi:MAG: aminodeoxychorismate synthase component I [Brevinematales bacterium]|nr:aminodeoxychorismate synthase component I [Brevinematales bacterium]
MDFKDEIIFVVDKGEYLLLFQNPILEIETNDYSNIIPSVKKLDDLLKRELYICGFICYEAGYSMVNLKFKHSDDKLPLLWFGIFTKPKIIEVPKIISQYSISLKGTTLSKEDYVEKIDNIKNYIKNGYTYQTNFTFKLLFDFEGDAFSFFLDLRKKQTVKYARFVKYRDTYILSLSPELFFKTIDRKIVTKPMKGTSRRGRFFEEDTLIAKKLSESQKDLAENLMIVDLLRNDIGTISEFGSVMVKDMFKIEKYETVFQMISTVEGILREDVKFSDILISLFPGGSITGAPKRKTMEIIRDNETTPRGIYTGTIGYITPSGFSEFNIAIRTPVIKGNKGEIGVGSGITWYSDPEDEYEECILKSKFLFSKPFPEFNLIETMLLKRQKIYLLEYHLRRLRKSANFFSFKYYEDIIRLLLDEVTKKDGTFKIRLLLSKEGNASIQVEKFSQKLKVGKIKLANDVVNSNDVFLFHKTTNRKLYDYYNSKAREEGLVDYIFTNQYGHITEGTVNNIILLSDGKLVTPSRSSGLLRGTMLEYLSRKYNIIEAEIGLDDLKNAQRIYLCNSVSGIKQVRFIV